MHFVFFTVCYIKHLLFFWNNSCAYYFWQADRDTLRPILDSFEQYHCLTKICDRSHTVWCVDHSSTHKMLASYSFIFSPDGKKNPLFTFLQIKQSYKVCFTIYMVCLKCCPPRYMFCWFCIYYNCLTLTHTHICTSTHTHTVHRHFFTT